MEDTQLKTTKGKWVVRTSEATRATPVGELFLSVACGKRMICRVSALDLRTPQDYDNAKLIAAAPALYAALENILASTNVRIDDPRCEYFDAGRQALALARGA